MKTIHTLIHHMEVTSLQGPVEQEVAYITADSRAIVAGSMFICLRGATVDGHNYIEQAIEKGAVAIISEEEREVPDHVALVVVPSTRVAMQHLVPLFYEYPARKMRMIGVTGTNGKTTTTHIIAHVLRQQGHKVGVIGTVHVLIGDDVYEVHNTTPDVVDLQETLQKMVDAGVTHCIMEVSSHALDLQRVAGVEFDTAVFTNLTQDHLDYHKTFDNYREAKGKLFELISESNPYKTPKGAVINIDDPAGAYMVDKCKVNTLTYSVEKESSLQAKDLTITAKTSDYKVTYEGRNLSVSMRVAGLFNVYNTLAAIGACLQEGVNCDDIIGSLANFSAVPGRFELIEEGQDFAVVVDYAHTPDGLENILETAKEITEGRIIVVFGCGGDRDATKRPIMGRIAATFGDVVYVTSDNPRTEDPQSIVDQVAAGVKEALRDGSTYEVIVDRKEAIVKAVQTATTGDVVIIAGKGHEDYQILKDRTIHFDDREVAREALKER